jgi:hypothetical protein
MPSPFSGRLFCALGSSFKEACVIRSVQCIDHPRQPGNGNEASVCLLGWFLGGPLGLGTLVFAWLIGPAVPWGFKLFKLQPRNLLEPEVGVTGALDD